MTPFNHADNIKIKHEKNAFTKGLQVALSPRLVQAFTMYWNISRLNLDTEKIKVIQV